MKKIVILSVVMILGAGNALAITLSVPFYRDGDQNGVDTVGFIGVKNTTTFDQTLTVIYTSRFGLTTDTPSAVLKDLQVTFALRANTGVAWRPVQSTGSEGPEGNAVPNNTLVLDGTNVSVAGSAAIKGIGLRGRYAETNPANGLAFAFALIE